MNIDITEQNGRQIFEATDSFLIKDDLKALGWRYNQNNKSWWIPADSSYVVQPFRYALSKQARDYIAHLKRKQRRQIATSRATTAEIDVPAPAGKKYYPFQLAGIRYLLNHPNAILGDEMGLGKTIQIIGLMNADRTISKTLIICPATLRSNWNTELERWSVRPVKRQILTKRSDVIAKDIDTLIISHDLLDSHQRTLSSIKWDLLVCDEAHLIRKKRTKRATALFGVQRSTAMGRIMHKYREVIFPSEASYFLDGWNDKVAALEHALQGMPEIKAELDNMLRDAISARRNIFATGTPIPNRPIDLWPIIQRVVPNGLGLSYNAFAERYCIRNLRFRQYDYSGASNLEELQERLRSTCMIRRLKSQVLPELPEKTYQLIELPAKGQLGKLILREKQQWEALISEGGNSFSGRKTSFAKISQVRADIGRAKLPYILDHISSIFTGCDKLVVMAHHKSVISEILRNYPDAASITGETSMSDRAKAVDRFQTDHQCRLFVGSIMAAGTGITLTAASIVLFAEQEWTPGAMRQAEDRLHRIGTVSSVLAQYLVVNESLDARMLQTHLEKSQIAREVLDL